MSTIASKAVIELKNIRFFWPKQQHPTLDISNLSVAQGEHLFVKGPSGCGKSTLLGLLTGINTVSEGELYVLGQELSTLSSVQRDRFRADHIGYIFQQFNLLPYLSVIENILLPCHFSAYRRSNVNDNLQNAARKLLTQLHVPKSLWDAPIHQLSTGQQQRVAVARALIGQPSLIIADEPTSALDQDNRTRFIQLLLSQVNQTNTTLIFVSHDSTLEHLFDRTFDLLPLSTTGECS